MRCTIVSIKVFLVFFLSVYLEQPAFVIHLRSLCMMHKWGQLSISSCNEFMKFRLSSLGFFRRGLECVSSFVYNKCQTVIVMGYCWWKDWFEITERLPGLPRRTKTYMNMNLKHNEVTYTHIYTFSTWFNTVFSFIIGHSSDWWWRGAQAEVHTAHRKEVFANWGHLSLSRNQGHLLPRSLNSQLKTQTQHLTTTSGLSKTLACITTQHRAPLSGKKVTHHDRRQANVMTEGLFWSMR